jgi:uncharacterized protein (DUF58 family)
VLSPEYDSGVLRCNIMQALTFRQRFKLECFTRGLGPEDAPIRLDRSRVFILPTGSGLAFSVMLLVMLFGSINYNNSLGHMFSFLLGSMVIVSILHTYRNLATLILAVGKSRPVFAGEHAGYEILVTNPAGYARIGISLKVADQPCVNIDVEPRGTTAVTLYRGTSTRGVLALGRCQVSSSYPLGLFRAWSYVEPRAQCLVYPRPGPPHRLPQRRDYKPSASGDKGRGVDDFAGFRPYRNGDSPRHLFWKAAAREQALLVKQFGGDRADELWLEWTDLNGLDTETRLSRLCRWVLEAEHERQCYGLRLPGVEIPIGRGDAHKQRCLEALARFE